MMSGTGITNGCKLTMWDLIINPEPSVKATTALKTKTALQTDLFHLMLAWFTEEHSKGTQNKLTIGKQVESQEKLNIKM